MVYEMETETKDGKEEYEVTTFDITVNENILLMTDKRTNAQVCHLLLSVIKITQITVQTAAAI
jgi:hypothetical protein